MLARAGDSEQLVLGAQLSLGESVVEVEMGTQLTGALRKEMEGDGVRGRQSRDNHQASETGLEDLFFYLDIFWKYFKKVNYYYGFFTMDTNLAILLGPKVEKVRPKQHFFTSGGSIGHFELHTRANPGPEKGNRKFGDLNSSNFSPHIIVMDLKNSYYFTTNPNPKK